MNRAAEVMNVQKLKEQCETKSRGEDKQKTKTKFVITKLNSEYRRAPDTFILRNTSIVYARALIMGRYGMLKCANNFSYGHGTKICDKCTVVDDENHRISVCEKWKDTNLVHSSEKLAFDDIYLDDYERCAKVVQRILSTWDLENGRNEMRGSL